MPARGYTTVDTVASVAGLTLTGAQISLVDQVLIEAAEAWIEERTGRTWLTGIITSEPHYGAGPNLYLRTTPVTSIQAVTARYSLSDTPDTALVAGTTYEARDLARGWLVLGTTYDRVLVSYTPAATVPARIQLAASLLVAHWLQPAMNGLMGGVESYSVGDLSVKLSAEMVKAGVPSEVLRLIPKTLAIA